MSSLYGDFMKAIGTVRVRVRVRVRVHVRVRVRSHIAWTAARRCLVPCVPALGQGAAYFE